MFCALASLGEVWHLALRGGGCCGPPGGGGPHLLVQRHQLLLHLAHHGRVLGHAHHCLRALRLRLLQQGADLRVILQTHTRSEAVQLHPLHLARNFGPAAGARSPGRCKRTYTLKGQLAGLTAPQVICEPSGTTRKGDSVSQPKANRQKDRAQGSAAQVESDRLLHGAVQSRAGCGILLRSRNDTGASSDASGPPPAG